MAYIKMYSDYMNDPSTDALNEWVQSLLESTKDPFDVLGIPRNSDVEIAKSAYRKLANRFHPDRNPGDKAAEEKFKEISAAYEMIKSPGKNKRRVDNEPAPSNYRSSSSSEYSRPRESQAERAEKIRKTEEERARAEEIMKRTAESIKRRKKQQDEQDARYAEMERKSAQQHEEFKKKMKDIQSLHTDQVHSSNIRTLQQSVQNNWTELAKWKMVDHNNVLYYTDNSKFCTIVMTVERGDSYDSDNKVYHITAMSEDGSLDRDLVLKGHREWLKEFYNLKADYKKTIEAKTKAAPKSTTNDARMPWYKKMFT